PDARPGFSVERTSDCMLRASRTPTREVPLHNPIRPVRPPPVLRLRRADSPIARSPGPTNRNYAMATGFVPQPTPGICVPGLGLRATRAMLEPCAGAL